METFLLITACVVIGVAGCLAVMLALALALMVLGIVLQVLRWCVLAVLTAVRGVLWLLLRLQGRQPASTAAEPLPDAHLVQSDAHLHKRHRRGRCKTCGARSCSACKASADANGDGCQIPAGAWLALSIFLLSLGFWWGDGDD